MASAILYARLPPRVGDTAPAGLRDLSPESRPIVAKISALFFVDALGGGFIGSAIFAYWFSERFGASAATVAVLFSAGRLLSAASHIAAAWLAKRIGLINTMVFTHVPSSLLLFTIVAADDFAWAAFFFLLRESLNEMDVPTRQSYVMAVVKPRGAARGGRDHQPRALRRLGARADARGGADAVRGAGRAARARRAGEDRLRRRPSGANSGG